MKAALVTRRPRWPQLEARTPLVAMAVARQVVEEASLWLGVPLPARYAAGLAFRAKITYAHSPSFRRALHRPGDGGRERCYGYMRHWLAARLQAERPELFRLLPAGYCMGEELPQRSGNTGDGTLSNDARVIFAL